jgi:hypothetical protein
MNPALITTYMLVISISGMVGVMLVMPLLLLYLVDLKDVSVYFLY